MTPSSLLAFRTRPAGASGRAPHAAPATALPASQCGRGRRGAGRSKTWVPPAATPPAHPTIGSALATLALAAALAIHPPHALAELQTVTLDEATAAAKPLPKQPVRTGRVWALIGLGAAGVFGAAVAVENNEAWFPAIAKANKAMAATKARAAVEGGAARAAATGSGSDAVAAGIAEASRRARERAEAEGREG